MKSVARTDIGRVRSINQDVVMVLDESDKAQFNLYIVADGMGGAKAGDYAAKALVHYVKEYIDDHDDCTIGLIRKAIEYANTKIYELSQNNKQLQGMGSTVVAAGISKSALYAFNVGDSRLYIVRDKLIQITKDHSLVEDEVAKGHITRGSEEYKLNKKYITRAVGVEREVDVDIFEVELLEGDKILLCSDGLSNMIDDKEIYDIISKSESLETAVDTLIETANEKGGTDNISAILINYEREV